MMISNHEQLILLLRCMGLGIWLGCWWEAINLIRRAITNIKYRRFVACMIDIGGMLVCGLAVFLFGLAANNGELRAVMLVAMGIGMITERRTLGRLIRAVVPRICRLSHKVSQFWNQTFCRTFMLCEKSRKKVGFFIKNTCRNTKLGCIIVTISNVLVISAITHI